MKNGGGHFAPELGGHFELESGAHFKLELGGQYHWNLQISTQSTFNLCLEFFNKVSDALILKLSNQRLSENYFSDSLWFILFIIVDR